MEEIRTRRGGPMLEYLETMIANGHFAPRTALPSLRALAEEFDVSCKVARHVLAHLAAKGLVECRQGSGTYVLPQRRRAAGTGIKIGLVHPGLSLDRSYGAHIAAGLRQRLEEHPECELAEWIIPSYYNFSAPELLEFSRGADVVLFSGPYDCGLAELPHCWPAVGVEMANDYEGWCSVLSLDPFGAAQQAKRYFRERRIRHVHLCVNAGDRIHWERGDLFESAWREIGTADRRPDVEDDDPSHGWWFSGSDDYNAFARAYLERTGEDFASGHTVLSLDAKAHFLPPGALMKCDSLGTDWVNLGRLALDEALRRFANPGTLCRRIMQGCLLYRREPEDDRAGR